MIVGLSHVALSVSSIELAQASLARLGYTVRFSDRDLRNDPSKKPLLQRYQDRHSILALEAPGAMAIELLDHGGVVGDQTSALIPVFRTEQPVSDWEEVPLEDFPLSSSGLDDVAKAVKQTPRGFFDPALNLKFLWVPSGETDGAGLFACVVPSSAPAQMGAMLKQLRFREDPQTGLWALLTPIPTLQARLLIAEQNARDGWSRERHLDAPGCAVLALMARKAREVPYVLGADPVAFELDVDGATTRITLCSPEHGPIIELVERLQ